MKALAIVAFVLAALTFSWWLFKVVFNVVVHDVFHGPSITFWQAAACVTLIGFVTGGLSRAVAK